MSAFGCPITGLLLAVATILTFGLVRRLSLTRIGSGRPVLRLAGR